MALTSLQESQLLQATIGRVNMEPVSSGLTLRTDLKVSPGAHDGTLT